MAARKVKLINANLRNPKLVLGAEVLTQVTVSAPFERLVAEQLGLTSRVYAKKGSDEDPDIDDFGPSIEWYGAVISLRPKQATLNGKVKTTDEITLPTLKVWDFKIKRHADDQQMLMTFNVKLQDEDAVLHQMIHSVKKGDIDIDVEVPSKKKGEEALAQLKLAMKGAEEEEEDSKGKKKRGDIGVTVEG